MSLTLAMSILMTGCKTQEVQCNWSATPIRIDGKIADWADMPAAYFEEEGAALGICNDSNHFYINLRTKDATQARMVRITGLTIYLDAEGKRGKDFFIRFRGGPVLEMPLRQGRGRDGFPEDKRPGMRERFPEMATDTSSRFTCYQKGVIVEKPIHPDGSEGPSAACDTSMGFYTYEFSIPLQGSVVRYYGLGAQPGQVITIGAEWGGLENLRDRNRMQGGPRGGPPAMEPGSGRGGMGGGRSGSRPSGMQRPEKQEVWVKIQLAVPPTELSE